MPNSQVSQGQTVISGIPNALRLSLNQKGPGGLCPAFLINAVFERQTSIR